MVGIADQVGESNEAGFFFHRNWPKDAVLSMDCDPLQLNLGAPIVGGHLKVDVSFQMAFFPPGARPLKTPVTVPCKKCFE